MASRDGRVSRCGWRANEKILDEEVWFILFFLRETLTWGRGQPSPLAWSEATSARMAGEDAQRRGEWGTGGGDSPVSGTCVPCWEGWKRISRGSVVYVGRQKHATPDTRRDDDARAMPKPAHIVARGSREAMPHVGVVLSHLPAHLVRPHQPLISSCPA